MNVPWDLRVEQKCCIIVASRENSSSSAQTAVLLLYKAKEIREPHVTAELMFAELDIGFIVKTAIEGLMNRPKGKKPKLALIIVLRWVQHGLSLPTGEHAE